MATLFSIRYCRACFEEGLLADEAGAGQVGDGAGHPQQAVVAAGRQGQTVVGQPQHLLGAGRQPADLPHLPGRQLGVAVDALIAQFGKPPGLDGPGGQDLLAQLGAGHRSMRSSSGPEMRLRY